MCSLKKVLLRVELHSSTTDYKPFCHNAHFDSTLCHTFSFYFKLHIMFSVLNPIYVLFILSACILRYLYAVPCNRYRPIFKTCAWARTTNYIFHTKISLYEYIYVLLLSVFPPYYIIYIYDTHRWSRKVRVYEGTYGCGRKIINNWPTTWHGTILRACAVVAGESHNKTDGRRYARVGVLNNAKNERFFFVIGYHYDTDNVFLMPNRTRNRSKTGFSYYCNT